MGKLNHSYENFPLWIVMVRNTLNILLLGMGALILAAFGTWAGISYLIISVLAIVWSIRFRCKYCYYFGKTCASGYGRIASLLFKKGRTKDFPKYEKYGVPLFVITFLPFLGLGVLFIGVFSLKLIGLLLFYASLIIFLAKVFYRKFGCDHCKQNSDCPSYQ